MVFLSLVLTLYNACGREQITSFITYWLLEQESCSNLKKRTENHLKILDFEQYTMTGYVVGIFLGGRSAWREGESGYLVSTIMDSGTTGPRLANICVFFLLSPQLDYISQLYYRDLWPNNRSHQ